MAQYIDSGDCEDENRPCTSEPCGMAIYAICSATMRKRVVWCDSAWSAWAGDTVEGMISSLDPWEYEEETRTLAARVVEREALLDLEEVTGRKKFRKTGVTLGYVATPARIDGTVYVLVIGSEIPRQCGHEWKHCRQGPTLPALPQDYHKLPEVALFPDAGGRL